MSGYWETYIPRKLEVCMYVCMYGFVVVCGVWVRAVVSKNCCHKAARAVYTPYKSCGAQPLCKDIAVAAIE